MNIDNATEAARYGRLATVAINFYIQTGCPAEQDAAVCYSRAALYFARRADAAIEHDYASSETAYGRTAAYDFAIKLF